MPKSLFAASTFATDDYPLLPPTAPDPCASLRALLNKARPGWMVGQEKYKNFMVNVAAPILELAPSKGISLYGALFIIAQSAAETGYATNDGSKKNNYWGHRANGKVDLDYSDLTFSESFDKYLDFFDEVPLPDMLTLLKSSVKVVVEPLSAPFDYDYYFTAEEVNQALNSGKYGGNGFNGTPKIVNAKCYNAEFYSLKIDYAKRIFSVLNKIFEIIRVMGGEIHQLAAQIPPCEANVPAITGAVARARFELVQFNLKWLKGKNYGYYMPNLLAQAIQPTNPVQDAAGKSVSRPSTSIETRLIPNNSKNVTIPEPED